MTHRRSYRSGSRWAFFRWTETPSGYITRLHLVQTPFGAIMLHWINGPDEEEWLHDHPVTFLSLILRGWYVERRWKPKWSDVFLCQRNWWNFIQGHIDDCHEIVQVAPGGCLTLCFMGPKVREWGFHTDEGWIGWKEYNDRTYHLSSKTHKETKGVV